MGLMRSRPIILGLLLMAAPAAAQDAQPQPPPPPPPGWIGSASAGLALTQGNSDTSNVNLAYEVKRETGSPWVFKSSGLFLRGESEGELITNRLAFNAREEWKLSERTALFGQLQYLRDTFKEIDYLVSPNVGVNRYLVKNDRTELGVDAGVGVVWEKTPGFELDTAGAVTAGQALQHKLTDTTTFTEKVTALWKMEDFEDALYAFTLGVASNVTDAIQMKVELLDTYKNKPLSATVVKNDVALVVSLVYKFD
jgi:putative salt-induced outer membrane protein YdiY